jgi:hypothetical protein
LSECWHRPLSRRTKLLRLLGRIEGGWSPTATRLLTSTSYPSLRVDPTGGRLAAARAGDRQEQIGLWSVADAREYRGLVHEGPERTEPGQRLPAVHPEGRLAALGLSDGAALFDVETGREVGFVKFRAGASGWNHPDVYFDGAGNLLTNT